MSYISSLKLHNFRCYEQAALSELGSGLIVLHGPNGAGKTNVLEAVSFLAPGRGLRAAKVMEVQCREAPKPWAVAAQVQTKHENVRLGTGLDAQTEKRIIRINEQNAKSQSALADYVACVWLTPQMDRLFIDAAGQRRRFLDRLVFAFDPGHSGRTTRYENAMRQRSKLLQDDDTPDIAWLDSLESQMAETGTALAAARLEFAQRLQRACDKSAQDQPKSEFFPRAILNVSGTIEELLHNAPALEVEEMFAYQLKQSREKDARVGGAATGPHKSDLLVRYAAKDMPADQCSTGEQKALLIGLVLAHARLIAAERGAPPILLLDEVAAHLDEDRRGALYDLLIDLGGQVWLTGTEEKLFEAIESKAQFFEVHAAAITPQLQPSCLRSVS
ncbi:MAG: DNA replication and repair protein RecF [Micavibrio sp.]|nr:MAG: DNA replication and repair protein RecF [Micavibrio sp.]